jgi:LysR family transcriptional regulator, glycine cleavage system transcriptional activator
MRRLRRRLPPPNSLVAFEAAGRLCGFTSAASELNVTQAAVGRQIRALEAWLGIPLFERTHRTLRLTERGRQFHKVVASSLEQIARAAAEAGERSGERQLTVGTTHGFATFWLLPRLGSFRERFPGIDLRLLTFEADFDLASEGIELGILFGDGNWPGVESTYFLEEEIFPVCSPAYLARRIEKKPLRTAADLLGETLLHPNLGHPAWMDWAQWLPANGVEPGRSLPGNHFTNYANAIQAALDGHGIVLAWRYLHDDLLARGLLVRPIEASYRSRNGYFIATPKERPKGPLALMFQEWLLAEAKGAAMRYAPRRTAIEGDAPSVDALER